MSAGKSRAFARKMMEYQQPNNPALAPAGGSNNNLHRPLSQRSSIDVPQAQLR